MRGFLFYFCFMADNYITDAFRINLQRYPITSNRSLKPFNNADILALESLSAVKGISRVHVFNDRFGFWNCSIRDKSVHTVWVHASERKAIQYNLKRNDLSIDDHNFYTPLDELETVELALVKIPKSVELFELYLQQIHKSATSTTTVVCGFMTKYFNPSLLKVASKYFKEVNQSQAWKKARLLTLSNPKEDVDHPTLVNSVSWKGKSLDQYYGVFSSSKIDYGIQFLLEGLRIHEDEVEILDLASGNGVIALEAQKLQSNAKLTLLDDSNLAVESSKLNLSGDVNYVCDNDLSQLVNKHFDLVLSNPPFHFEHENNIEVALDLFKGVSKVLKPNGRFLLVANRHLNYSTHLRKMFSKVSQLRSNDKFEVIECQK